MPDLEHDSAPLGELTKHTPGPWRVGYWLGRCTKPSHAGGKHVGLRGDDPCVYDPVFVPGTGIAAENGKMVVTTVYDELAMADADAALIAAAPDMLEGGKAQTAILRKAQAILTEYLIPDGLSEGQAIDALLGLLDGPEQRAAQSKWDAAIAKAEGGAA